MATYFDSLRETHPEVGGGDWRPRQGSRLRGDLCKAGNWKPIALLDLTYEVFAKMFTLIPSDQLTKLGFGLVLELSLQPLFLKMYVAKCWNGTLNFG